MNTVCNTFSKHELKIIWLPWHELVWKEMLDLCCWMCCDVYDRIFVFLLITNTWGHSQIPQKKKRFSRWPNTSRKCYFGPRVLHSTWESSAWHSFLYCRHISWLLGPVWARSGVSAVGKTSSCAGKPVSRTTLDLYLDPPRLSAAHCWSLNVVEVWNSNAVAHILPELVSSPVVNWAKLEFINHLCFKQSSDCDNILV